jgi:hypothetical protein
MENITWKLGAKTGWSTTFRGIGIVIRVDKTGRPTELQFFVQGKLDSEAPLSCNVDATKRIALETIDRLMPDTPHWQAAENRHLRDWQVGDHINGRVDVVHQRNARWL